ncbi:MAG: Proteasome-activating nucleotidase [Methanosaeta sp. PtaU1.Bin112]|nr:MAG: Proteasome-activating nucleotidase [Methanosaeta sp. PtaU1.Bin112]
MNSEILSWQEANQRYLSSALGEIKDKLSNLLADKNDLPGGMADDIANGGVSAPNEHSRDCRDRPDNLACIAREEQIKILSGMASPPTLDIVCRSFGLSKFERDLILLCAGAELDSGFAALLAQAQSGNLRGGGFLPTFGLALAILDDPHWSAISPASPLRSWRLVEVLDGKTLTSSPLRIEEKVLHYLAGVCHSDERLEGFIEPISCDFEIFPTHRALAESIAACWQERTADSHLYAIELYGSDALSRRSVAQAASAILGLNLHRVELQAVPQDCSQFLSLLRIWERDCALSGSALLLEYDDNPGEPVLDRLASRLADKVACPLIVSTEKRRRDLLRATLSFEIAGPSREEQRALWAGCMKGSAMHLDGDLDAIVSEFDLSSQSIRNACSEMTAKKAASCRSKGKDDNDQRLLQREIWDACRSQVRPNLDALAQRIVPVATWADLVLPAMQTQILRDIAIHVRNRAKVYGQWGFERKLSMGKGISVLFSGASGTGKTLAAEVLANELGLDLYRIDLSSVVSKYIGETEKNLKRVFDAAEQGGCLLLFDEADALFGKRSEVKDSHDRYANIEVSYLLQRMEAYRGLAILTTNMKKSLDPAFLRRIRFSVNFPFPDAEQRGRIWMRIFPPQAPKGRLDMEKLSRLNVAGGNIKNIALYSAFLAAEESQPIGMGHLLHAARVEYAKLEKPLTEAEIGGWI